MKKPEARATRLQGVAAPLPRVGGMLIGYYMICPRKAWLSMHGLWMEQESEVVQLGKQVGEQHYQRAKKELFLEVVAPDRTPLVGRIDWVDLQGGVLHETKKSRAMEESHRWQLRFYLWLLKLAGVTGPDDTPFTGMLNYPLLRKTEPVSLRPEDEAYLLEITAGLRELAGRKTPPPRHPNRSFCKTCAFEDLCYG